MISLIKQLLRESLLEAEFDRGGHTIERIKQRIESISDDDLAFEVKEKVLYNLDKIKNVDFSKKKDFTVMLGAFTPDPASELYLTDDRGRGYYRIYSTEPNDALKDSTGDEFWMIIRGNIIKTFFLRKGWQTKNLELNSEKLGLDYSFKNVDQAIKTLGGQSMQQASNEPVVVINGVKWLVNPSDETIFKKNNPNVKHSIEDILNQVDEPTQEKIMSFL